MVSPGMTVTARACNGPKESTAPRTAPVRYDFISTTPIKIHCTPAAEIARLLLLDDEGPGEKRNRVVSVTAPEITAFGNS
jgi:hypothetical protein